MKRRVINPIRSRPRLAAALATIALFAASGLGGQALAEDLSYCRQAQALEGQGRRDEQVAFLSMCLATGDLTPQNLAIAFYHRGNAQTGLGRQRFAIQDYDRAILIDANFTDAYFNRGVAYRNLFLYDRAIEDYDRAIRLAPGRAQSYSSRGNAHADMGRFELAIQDFDAALALDPKSLGALNNRGNALRDHGRYDLAIRDYDRAIMLDPNYGLAYENRGLAYYESGQMDRAVAEFRAVVALQPENAYPALLLHMAMARVGGAADAELAANAGRLDLRKWPGAIVRFALGKSDEGEVLEAAQDARSTTRREQECEAYYYLGMARLARADPSGAAAMFRSAIDTGVRHFIEFHQAEFELVRLNARGK